MNSTRIGQNQVASRHKVMEIQHVERLDDVDSLVVAEDRVRCLTHDRVHVDRIDRLDVGVLVHHTADRAKHVLHRLAEVLAAVGGDEDQPTAGYPFQLGVTIVLPHRCFQCVDGGVAGNVDRAFVLALAEEILLRQLGRREIVSADDADRLPVEFLRVRAVNVVGTQACFDVADRDLQVETGQSGHEGGRRVAVDEDNVWSDRFEDFLDAVQDVRRDVEQRLLVLHNREIVVRHDSERFQHLIEHLAVLPGDADEGVDFAVPLEFIDERAHFYRFGSRSEDEHDFLHRNAPFKCDKRRGDCRYCGSPARLCQTACPCSPESRCA